MKIALIPPASQLHWSIGRRVQMMIPAFAVNEEYRRWYRTIPQHSPNSFLILDNGAFEKTPLRSHDLLGMAFDYDVDEVIAPDTMGDADKTLGQLQEFMAQYMRREARPKHVMAVVQGSSIEDCQYCIRGIAELFPLSTHSVTTLGFPKHLAKTTGWEDARIQLLRWVLKEYPGVWDHHFLGYNREGELMMAAELGVRSLDTSAPFVCAAENMSIGPTKTDFDFSVPERQPDFVNLGKEFFHPNLTRRNITTLDKWANYMRDGVAE